MTRPDAPDDAGGTATSASIAPATQARRAGARGCASATAATGSAERPRRAAAAPRPPRARRGRRRDRRRRRASRKPRLKKLRIALVLLGLAVLALVSWIFGIMMAVAQDLPALENRAQYERAENSVVYDRNGDQAGDPDQQRGPDPARVEEIAPTMKQAVVAIEDQRFYEHRGVDFHGHRPRASTRTSSPAPPPRAPRRSPSSSSRTRSRRRTSRTILQKLREAALAYQLERQWSKDKILTEYLNSIYFGEGAYGIEAAARTYFGCDHPGCGRARAPTAAPRSCCPGRRRCWPG